MSGKAEVSVSDLTGSSEVVSVEHVVGSPREVFQREEPRSESSKSESLPRRYAYTEVVKDAGIKIHVAGTQGSVRKSMEDGSVVDVFSVCGETFVLVAVMDGHGGKGVVEYIRSHLVDRFRQGIQDQQCHRSTGQTSDSASVPLHRSSPGSMESSDVTESKTAASRVRSTSTSNSTSQTSDTQTAVKPDGRANTLRIPAHVSHRLPKRVRTGSADVNVVWRRILESVMRKVFLSLHEEVCRRQFRSGSTLTVWLRRCGSEAVCLGLVGDSSIKLVDPSGKVKYVHRIHNVSNVYERRRVDQHDTVEVEDGYVRNKSKQVSLAMTRAIGDRDMGAVIIAEPRIRYFERSEGSWLLATDGLWDVLTTRSGARVPVPWKEALLDVNHAKYLLNWRNKTFPQHDNTTIIVIEELGAT